ncbi:MAG: 2-aminoethylphosphonate--pyruvate transaminase [Nanoarchaeota archaeon]|nr:2-aminoethylphosphonate--pyruvate transaminase [Nanoarchaeota archaeon]
MEQIKRNILLNPGPATTTDSVKMAQVVPDICHREKEFSDIVKSVRNDLTKIAGGDNNYVAVLFGGSGTAGMDAIINSVIPPNQKILVINNGVYGNRIGQITKAYNIDLFELKFEWDQLPDTNKIEDILKEDNKIACVAMVHHETTTGLLNPVKEIGALVKKYNKVFIVDTISSFAGIPFNIKDFNIDFMMSTSNKCIQGMAGVFFVICKKQELEKIKDYPRRSFYLSLYDEYEYFEKNNEMRFTPPVQTIYALRKAIDEFFDEGAENRYLRYTKNWKKLRKGIEDIGFKILTNPEYESHLLITILYPEDSNFNFQMLHDKLYEKGFTIYPGKVGKLNTFRLANMGAIDQTDIEKFLFELKNTLDELGVKLV